MSMKLMDIDIQFNVSSFI